MKQPILSLVALAALSAAGLGGATAVAQQGEAVAAIVNDDVISTFDVRQRAILILVSAGIEPTAETFNQVRGQALRSLVDERLQLQEAKNFKIDVTDKEVDNAITNIARSNRQTLAEFRSTLEGAGVSISTLRAQVRAEISWQRLVGGRYGSRVRIPETQIRDALSRAEAGLSKPRYLMAEVFLPADNPAEMREAEEAANRLIEEMRAGAPFPQIARQFSAAPSAAAGGDLGWISEPDIREDLLPAVQVLQPGQISTPVRTRTGIYIIAVREKAAGTTGAAVSQVSLQQVSAPAAGRAALTRLATGLNGCDGLAAAVEGVAGALVVDLGELVETELDPEMAARVQPLGVGKASPVFDAAEDRVATLAVCARRRNVEGVPSRDQMEDRLYEQELAMLSQRYLRNLRREATIINRLQ